MSKFYGSKKRKRKSWRKTYKKGKKAGFTSKQMKTVRKVAKKVAAKEDTRQSYQKTYKLQTTAALTPFTTSGSARPIRAILKYCDLEGAVGSQEYDITDYYGSTQVMMNIRNSCYDPNLASGGHQPRGWDELTGTNWLKYRVIKLKTVCHISCINYNQTSSGVGTPAVLCPAPAVVCFQRCNINGSGNYDSPSLTSEGFPYSLAELSGIKGTGVKLIQIPCDGKPHKISMTTRMSDIYGKVPPQDGFSLVSTSPSSYTFSHRLIAWAPNTTIVSSDVSHFQFVCKHETYLTVELIQPVSSGPS